MFFFQRWMNYVYPLVILSFALGRVSLAILAGDVITQLTCQSINATVLHILAFDNDIFD